MGSLKFVAIALLAGLLGSPYGLGRTPSAEEPRQGYQHWSHGG
jgi:hypothetical protein